jgi:hypothetical protein
MLGSNEDVIIGSFTGYEFDTIRLWVNSLDRSGFSGSKVILCAQSDEATIRELQRRNYSVVRFSMDDDDPAAIFRERYFQLSIVIRQLIDKRPHRFIIAPDMRDVIFQANPSDWLIKNIANCCLVAGSECLTHENEDWAREMMQEMFGQQVYDLMKHKLVYNAGTMAGRPREFSEFCMTIYLMQRTKSKKFGLYPDQAAANLLMHLTTFGAMTKFAAAESAWACQAGTTVDPSIIDKYRGMLTEPEPSFDGFVVKTSAGIPYYLVHQHDRLIPSWRDQLKELYW